MVYSSNLALFFVTAIFSRGSQSSIEADLGGSSKILWVMLGTTLAITAIEIVMIAQGGSGDYTIPAVQIAAIGIGGIVIWRMGGKIVEGLTRIYEEGTRIWGSASKDPAAYGSLQQPMRADSRTASSQLFCVHCGSVIPDYATFCRYCGKRQ
jgi:hypothetical protein